MCVSQNPRGGLGDLKRQQCGFLWITCVPFELNISQVDYTCPCRVWIKRKIPKNRFGYRGAWRQEVGAPKQQLRSWCHRSTC